LGRLREIFHKSHNIKRFQTFSGRAIRVTTASPTATASDAEMNEAHAKVVDALKAQLPALVRE
jgi:hypothetical protein